MWEFQRNRNTCGQQAAAVAELDGGVVTMGTKKTYLEKLLPGYLKLKYKDASLENTKNQLTEMDTWCFCAVRICRTFSPSKFFSSVLIILPN